MRDLPKLEFDTDKFGRRTYSDEEYRRRVRQAQNADWPPDDPYALPQTPIAHPYDVYAYGIFSIALAAGILWLFGG